MSTTLTNIPPARAVNILATPGDLPAGPCFSPPDLVEGLPEQAGGKSRDCFTRHGVRVSVISGGVEIDRFYSHEPAADAASYLLVHPGVSFGLLVGTEIRDANTGETL
jgi:hypothetical protein